MRFENKEENLDMIHHTHKLRKLKQIALDYCFNNDIEFKSLHTYPYLDILLKGEMIVNEEHIIIIPKIKNITNVVVNLDTDISEDFFEKEISDEQRKYKEYRYSADRMTERRYNKHKDFINPNGLIRGQGVEDSHLDHKFSVRDGYDNNISIEIISHPNNLCMMPSRDNLIKNSSSSISLDALLATCS